MKNTKTGGDPPSAGPDSGSYRHGRSFIRMPAAAPGSAQGPLLTPRDMCRVDWTACIKPSMTLTAPSPTPPKKRQRRHMRKAWKRKVRPLSSILS